MASDSLRTVHRAWILGESEWNRTANPAGSCVTAVEQTEGGVVLERELTLAKRRYTPEEWPALRRLLLVNGHDGNRLILLK